MHMNMVALPHVTGLDVEEAKQALAKWIAMKMKSRLF